MKSKKLRKNKCADAECLEANPVGFSARQPRELTKKIFTLALCAVVSACSVSYGKAQCRATIQLTDGKPYDPTKTGSTQPSSTPRMDSLTITDQPLAEVVSDAD